MQTLERFSGRVMDRQRAMYGSDAPFAEKWRTAMGYIDEDLAAGYPKVWAELEALAWNHPEMRARLNGVNESWRSLLRDALADAIEEYELDSSVFSAEALAALVMQFNKGLLYERLLGFDRGHADLLASIDRWLTSLEEDAMTVLLAPPARSTGRDAEQSRALYPETEGFVERDGQRLFYEVYGEGEETIFLLPTWSLVHSRHWKMQIHYFARHFRVLTMDGLGNGRSDRCRDPKRYEAAEFARDCLAVMDATDTERAAMASLSRGAQSARAGSAGPRTGHRRRLHQPPVPLHAVALVGAAPEHAERRAPAHSFRWWGHMNPLAWPERYPEFAEWFISRGLPEPHSTKGIEDGVGWALDTDPETLIATASGDQIHTDRRTLRDLARRLDCPVLVIHGDRDRITPPRDGRALARLSEGQLEVVPGAGRFSILAAGPGQPRPARVLRRRLRAGAHAA